MRTIVTDRPGMRQLPRRKRETMPGPLQTQCPHCGCRYVTRTSTGYGITELVHGYRCDECGAKYQMRYGLTAKTQEGQS